MTPPHSSPPAAPEIGAVLPPSGRTRVRSPRSIPPARIAWLTVAALLLLTGLWDDRGALLGADAPARATSVQPPIAGGTGPVALVRAGRLVRAATASVSLTLDLATGHLIVRWPRSGVRDALDGLAGARLRGSIGSGPAGEVLAGDYAHHAVSAVGIRDALGVGTRITFSHSDPRYPPMRQTIALYPDSPGVILRVELGVPDGPTLDVSRIDPLLVDRPSAATLTDDDPLVFAINGLTADHMPRQFLPLAALPSVASLPYVASFAGAGGTLLAGALDAAAWFPSVGVDHAGGALTALSLACIGPVTGRVLATEPFLLGRYPDGTMALRAYAAALGRLQPPPSPRTAQLGWSSWGAFELAVTDRRVRRNTDFMAAHLKGLGYTTIHIDDGWERRYGDWQAGPSFPRGMAETVAHIHARGLAASIWFAPFLATPDSWPARVHPEWLLRNVDGSPVSILVSGPTYVLDASNPDVLAYIRAVCAQIRAWGFDGVKLDFLYTGELEGQRYRFDLNGVQAYHAAIRAIRDALEVDPRHPLFLTGVQQGFLPAGFFEGWRVGRDIESRTNADHLPTWDLVIREALAASAFAFAGGDVYATDADDLLLRRVRNARNLSADELQSYATMVALGGAIWLSGDDLPTLARQGRLGYLTDPEVLAVVRAGRAGTPLHPVDQAIGPAPVWVAPQPDGSVAVGIFNWSGIAQTRTVAFVDLGMAAGTGGYRVRDLWTHTALSHGADAITLTVRPHQSYLLRIAR